MSELPPDSSRDAVSSGPFTAAIAQLRLLHSVLAAGTLSLPEPSIVALLKGQVDTLVSIHDSQLQGQVDAHTGKTNNQEIAHEARIKDQEARIKDQEIAHEARIKDQEIAHEARINHLTTIHETKVNYLATIHETKINHLATTHEAKLDQVVVPLQEEIMHLRHEKELAERDKTHLAAVYRDKIQRLRSHIAQLECMHPSSVDKVYGTQTAAEIWRDHRKLPPGPSPWMNRPPSVDSKTVKKVLLGQYAKESDIYDPFVKLANKLLEPHNRENPQNTFQVLDTSTTRYLSNRQPDVTIQASPSYIRSAMSSFVLTVIDVKHDPNQPRQLSNSDKGQMLDYLYKLLLKQPWRRVFVGLVTTLHHNCWIQLTRSVTGEHKVVEIAGCETLAAALSYLVDVVLPDRTQWPPTPAFSKALGQCHSLLGLTKNSLVAQFEWPAVSPSQAFQVFPRPSEVEDDESSKPWIAVKRLSHLPSVESSRGNRPPQRTLKHEIDLLCLLKSHNCPSLPQIAWYTKSYSEFGITPVGESLHPSQLLPRPALAATILADVYDALNYLHQQGWVHRDVRWANIVSAHGRGVLVDFETAYRLKGKSTVPYAGGFLCMPPRLLRTEPSTHLKDIRYTPRTSDDWTAFLLLLVALIVPGPALWLTARSEDFADGTAHLRAGGPGPHGGWDIGMSAVADPSSKERAYLVALWKTLKRSQHWAEYVAIAESYEEDGTVSESNQDAQDSRYHPLRNMATSVLAVVPPYTPGSSPASSSASSEIGGDMEELVTGTKALGINADSASYGLVQSGTPEGDAVGDVQEDGSVLLH